MEGAEAMIELKNVSFSYGTVSCGKTQPAEKTRPLSDPAAHEILHGLTLKIESGSRICLFGPSGIGKSTLLRLMMGLETPSSGSITGIQKLKKAVVFQEDRLLPFATVLKNLTLFGSSLAAHTHLKALGLAGQENAFPSSLSGGMKRRVAIARALTRNGDILFLDEPFTGLDVPCRKKTADYILSQSTGKTIILVSHDKTEAALLQSKIINVASLNT